MRPATIHGGIRKGIEYSTAHEAAMKGEGGQKPSSSSTELPKELPNQSVALITDRLHDPPVPQLSNFGLRHNIHLGGANVNMPDAYAKIQAYKPPAYVSPYGGTEYTTTAADKNTVLPTRESKPRRLSSEDDPPWLCCFAQKKIPEWSRHPEIWNPGTAGVCTVSVANPCQHKKCEDCLWESLEEAPEDPKVQSRPISKPKKTSVETDAAGVDDDPEGAVETGELAEEAFQKETIQLGDSPEMTPSTMLVSKATNRDPNTGRFRLWPKD